MQLNILNKYKDKLILMKLKYVKKLDNQIKNKEKI